MPNFLTLLPYSIGCIVHSNKVIRFCLLSYVFSIKVENFNIRFFKYSIKPYRFVITLVEYRDPKLLNLITLFIWMYCFFIKGNELIILLLKCCFSMMFFLIENIFTNSINITF